MRAGPRDKLIVFERASAAAGQFRNEPPSNWTELNRAYAAVTYGTGQERRQAATESTSQVATFRILRVDGQSVTTGDRIQFDGRAWDITSIAPIRRVDIEFAAIAKGK